MVKITSLTRKCPVHRLYLVWNADLELWCCPSPGCTYMIPGTPPSEAEQAKAVTTE